MQTRLLGTGGPQVSAIGLGCMGMSEFYGPNEEAQSLATLHTALELGVNFWDTADMYGLGANERLLSQVVPGHRAQVFLATKFGVVRDDHGGFSGINGRPEYVKAACDASLKRLGVEYIDLYYQHRMDPEVAIEETVGAMADLVQAGKVRYLGLSEASAATLRRAHAVHPIHALQSEYSLWTRNIEDNILPACRELGVSLVAYSPLGRGFLSGRVQQREELSENDWRRNNPRFAAGHFETNRALARGVAELAENLKLTPAQLALAWLLAQGRDIIPIPGTRSPQRLRENTAAAAIQLDTDSLEQLRQLIVENPVSGSRYPEAMMTWVQP